MTLDIYAAAARAESTTGGVEAAAMERYAAICGHEPADLTDAQENAAAALDAARERLQGGPRAAKDQLSLDLRGR